MSDFSFVKASANNQTVEETYLVGAYELGAVIRSYHYHKRYGATTMGRAYLADCKGELADFISMLRMYCEQTNVNYANACRIETFMRVTSPTMEKTHIRLHRSYSKIHPGSIVLLQDVSRVIRHLQCMCKHLTWNYVEIEKFGEERYLERMQDLKQYGRPETLKSESAV